MKRDLSKQPKWVQAEIASLKRQLDRQAERVYDNGWLIVDLEDVRKSVRHDDGKRVTVTLRDGVEQVIRWDNAIPPDPLGWKWYKKQQTWHNDELRYARDRIRDLEAQLRGASDES